MATRTSPVPLQEADDAATFGGKAAQLAIAARAGLPVPQGLALPWPFVDTLAAGDDKAKATLQAAASSLGPALAVRSSAVGEDSEAASFAGQHLSLLNVPAPELLDAVREVSQSVQAAPALAYRRRLGLPDVPRAGVLVQDMVDPDVAGVLFCPNPATGTDEIVIEAAWGLGEAVVGGLVTPDLFRLTLQGEVVERRSGVKDVAVTPRAGGGTTKRPVVGDRASALCLADDRLGELHRLAVACKRVFGGSQDLEWAFARGALWLLQRRSVTQGAAAAP